MNKIKLAAKKKRGAPFKELKSGKPMTFRPQDGVRERLDGMVNEQNKDPKKENTDSSKFINMLIRKHFDKFYEFKG